MNSIATAYTNKEQVRDTVKQARKFFGDRRTTRDQYDGMEKSLGLAYLYCPEEMREVVFATLEEATRRKPFFEFNVW